jgi:hypothetical protein
MNSINPNVAGSISPIVNFSGLVYTIIEWTVGEWILSSSKINWGNNVRNGPLDYKCKTIFKYKRNGEKLIDGWDVKIEKK